MNDKQLGIVFYNDGSVGKVEMLHGKVRFTTVHSRWLGTWTPSIALV